jgi:hypothetical protein
VSWYDYLPSIPFQLANAATGGGPYADAAGYAKDAYQWGQQRSNVPQIGPNPYQGDWTSLIRQLQATARGDGPSLAGNAYKQASDNTMRNMQSLSSGGSAGGAREAIGQMGRIGQGLAQGYSNARLQEQLATQQMLQGALTGGGNAWFQPQQANLQATMKTPTNMQQILALLQQAGPIGSAVGL